MNKPAFPQQLTEAAKRQPSSAGSALLKHLADEIEEREQRSEIGYYVTDLIRARAVVRGPFQHFETAAAIRAELEQVATKEQNERWNLALEFRGPDLTEPTLDATLECPPAPWHFGGLASLRPDGQRVVTIISAHEEDGGQNIASCLESCATLIMAAPELLSACKRAERWLSNPEPPSGDTWEAMRTAMIAAIQKATQP